MDKSQKNLTRDLTSIHVQNEDRLANLANIDSVVIVGSTCTGKTTMADVVRQSHLATRNIIEVPKRYITRPPRLNDNDSENQCVSKEEFQARIRRSKIGLHWIRKMDGEREKNSMDLTQFQVIAYPYTPAIML